MRSPAEILRDSMTIAVVGASRHPDKEAHTVPRQMQRHGWRIIPVNPQVDELYGEICYPSLADIPVPVDLVNVFRPGPDCPPVARAAVAIGAKALWLQQGIVSAESRQIAIDAGLDYVEDHCIAVERAVSAISRRQPG